MTRLAGTGGKLVACVAVLVLGFGVVACSDDDDSSGTGSVSTAVSQAGGAESELCEKIGDLDTAVTNAQDLDSSSSVDDAQEAKDGISEALDGVKDAAGAVVSALVSVLQTAADALGSAIDNLSGDQTIGEAASAVSTQVAGVSNALDGLKSQAGCS